MNRKRTLLIAAFALCCSLPETGLTQPKVTEGVITDERGMSLYWWNNDVPGSGKSTCDGACVLSWPPFVAKADAKPSGDFTFITRVDGSKQWAHKGRPLYLWVNDTKPGDKSGDGFRKGLWHLATP